MNKRQEKYTKKVIGIFGPYLTNIPSEITDTSLELHLKCSQCESLFSYTVRKLMARYKTYEDSAFMCKVCANKKARSKSSETNQERYGGHYMKLDKFKDRVAATNMQKYGGKAPAHSKDIIKKMQATNMERYGSINAQGNAIVRAKSEATSIKNYGVLHPMKSEEVKAKLKQTFVDNYGVDNPTKDPKIRAKQLETLQNNHGVINPMQIESVKERAKQTWIENYGVDHPLKDPEIMQRAIKNSLIARGMPLKDEVLPKLIEYLKNPNNRDVLSSTKFESTMKISYSTAFRWLRESGNEDLIPRPKLQSSQEQELFEWISSIYSGDIIQSDRTQLKPKEIDIYLPELKLGIEYNGLYWHSELRRDKNYHFDKRVQAEQKGITLIQINSDEWSHKQDIVKSLILAKLGLLQTRVYARKTEVKRVPQKQALEFLQQNHLMGSSRGTSNLGLYSGLELVCIATYKKHGNQTELVRFCSKLNHSVIGGLSKLLRRLPKTTITSFVDLRYANGASLKTLGFELMNQSLGFKWTDFQITHNRSYCQVSSSETQAQKALRLGLFKIFDAGQAKWVFNS